MAILNRQKIDATERKIDPTKQYVVLTSFHGPHGPFREGQIVDGDHPAVAQAAQFFVPSGLADDAVKVAANALQSRAIATAMAVAPYGPHTSDGSPMATQRPLTAAEAVVCTKAVGMTGNSKLLRRPVVVGEVLAKADPIVAQFGSHFRPATDADLGAPGRL